MPGAEGARWLMLAGMATATLAPTTPHAPSATPSPERWDWPQLLSFCHAVARSHTDVRHEAEEAAQEAAARVWRYRDECRAPSDPRPWIATIVRREVHRLGAARSARREVLLGDLPEPAAECAHIAGAPDRAAIDAALRSLRPGDQRILLLRYARDMTQPAIARALGVPEGTVKIRLHRARSRLRDAFQASDGTGKQTAAVGIRVP
jgi:RNA polymerase sigma-70 factor (ECF subfamily)